MDVTQALKDTENSLRDFIAVVLFKNCGANWIEECGVTATRIEHWTSRKTTEGKRQEAGVVEERLLYYADFYDLKTILKKHWSGEFSAAFGDWKTMEVWLTEMEKLRDPDAHRRELLPHQKNLLLGIAGEIRSRLVRYRSKQETDEDYYPRIESVRDNLGNIWVYEEDSVKFTEANLRPGDVLDFVITASDPLGEALEYGIAATPAHHLIVWQDDNSFQFSITAEHVRREWDVSLWIRSKREFHANGYNDDRVFFRYTVLPPRK